MDNNSLKDLIMVLAELTSTLNFMSDNIMEIGNKLDNISEQLSDLQSVTGMHNIDSVCDYLNSIEDELSQVNVNIDFYAKK